jgi:hypothetical protein
MIEAFKYGIKVGWYNRRVIYIIYFIQFIAGIFIASTFSKLIKSTIYESVSFSKLLDGYNHTVISDFLNHHAESISTWTQTFAWTALLFIPISVYLNGVLLHRLVDKEKSLKASLTSGLRTYLPFALVTLVVLIILIIWALITLYPLINLIQKVFEGQLSEPGLFVYYLVGGFAFYVGVVFILNWSIITRTTYLRNSSSMVSSMGKSFRKVLKHFPSALVVTTLFMLLQVLLIATYLLIENLSGMISVSLVIIFFLIQQLFVLIRIMWRLMLYSGIDRYHLGDDARVN